MKKNDAIGVAISLAVHALVLLSFGVITAATVEPQQIGYIEVELGPFAQGRPVQQSASRQANAPQVEPEPVQEQQQNASPPRVSKPVELPKEQVVAEDRIQASRTETVSPQQRNNPEAIRPEERPNQRPVPPTGGGAEDGRTGTANGAQGEGTDETRAAPFLIEGLNRTPLSAPLPSNVANTNVTIVFRFWVDPAGNVTRVQPLLKANPALERVAMDALRRWRFNSLPPNAPQQEQRGDIRFNFTAR